MLTLMNGTGYPHYTGGDPPGFGDDRADYEQALAVDPQYAPALYGRGIVKRITGDAAGSAAAPAAPKRHQPHADRPLSLACVRPG